GLVPVSRAAILRAIELNGVDVERNKDAFSCGRVACANPAQLEDLLRESAAASESLDAIVERRAAFLRDYQDRALADRYRALVDAARAREEAVAPGGAAPFTAAVARAYFKTLAYKDEYEVARLHADTDFLA